MTIRRLHLISKSYWTLNLHIYPAAFLLLGYSSLNFASDWMIRASMPFVCWGHILWLNQLKLQSMKKIASNILLSWIQDSSRRFFLNGMYCYVLFHVPLFLKFYVSIIWFLLILYVFICKGMKFFMLIIIFHYKFRGKKTEY